MGKSNISSIRMTLMFFMFVFTIANNCGARKMNPKDNHLQMIKQNNEIEHDQNHIDPSSHIFFALNDLQIGKTVELYFNNKNPTTSPHLLAREEANTIPFSSNRLAYLLELFSISRDSQQAEAVENTLKLCEMEALQGETMFCATSLESMLDLALAEFVPETHLKLLTTNTLTKPIPLFQNYTVLERPKEISATKMLGCHVMPYPYVVYYCHGQKDGKNSKLFEVLLGGDDGGRVQASAICHVDTSHWSPDHVAFSLLKIKPGTSSPVCHVLPFDDVVWVPQSA